MDRQNQAANQAGLRRHKTPKQLLKSVQRGKLVRVTGRGRFELHNVSYPYAHPDLSDLLNRLSALFRRECGLSLVVTSLARPISTQPRNASSRSVHPTGIAADLRLPPKYCRTKLEPTLLELERERVIEATRERRPPHYHITINPREYHRALKRGGGQLEALSKARSRRSSARKPSTKQSRRSSKTSTRQKERPMRRYRVRSGDTLWGLSQRWRVTVRSIKRLNQLRSSTLKPGQLLHVPH